jgi:hypothetical protein
MPSRDQTALEPVALGPTDRVPDRPFTSIDLIERDRGILLELLTDVQRLVEEMAAGSGSVAPFNEVTWESGGLTHRHIVCNPERLGSHPRLCVVGFFGERRMEVDGTPLEEANTAVVSEFAKYPGITSYSSMELAGGHWANLVLHDDPVDTEYWRQSELHAQAVKMLSRTHYRNVRIYNAGLTAPLLEDPTIALRRVKYFDFSGDSDWRAIRTLAD